MLSYRSVTLVLLGGVLLASTSPVKAAEESSMPGTLTGTVSMNSDYVSRGISQTANGLALMGSVDWSFETGFAESRVYAGAFAANVDFPGSSANLETDFSAGTRIALMEVNWDLGFSYYKYSGAPSSANLSYYEFILRGGHDFGPVQLSGQVNYSPDFSGGTGSSVYVNGRLDVPLAYQFVAFGTVGHQWIENNTLAGLPDYMDWSVGLSRPIWKFNVSATYTDTNLSENDCYSRAYGNVCSARGVVSVGMAF